MKALNVALMQPLFLPWVGYFELIKKVDCFVYLDDFQFSRQSWGHHNKIFSSAGGVQIISAPFNHPKSLTASYNEIHHQIDSKWKRKFLANIAQTYAKSRSVESVIPLLTLWLNTEATIMSDMSISFIEIIKQFLNIKKQIYRSSQFEYDRNAVRSQKILSLLKAVKATSYYAANGSFEYMLQDLVFPREDMPCFFQDHRPIEYKQVHSKVFVPYLSIIDALCNLPCSEVSSIISATPKWLNWEEKRCVHEATKK